MRTDPRFRMFRVPSWQIWLGGALAIALGVAIAILTAGLFIILAPIALLAWLIYRIRYGTSFAQRPTEDVIEVEYTVVSESEREKPSGLRDTLPKRKP